MTIDIPIDGENIASFVGLYVSEFNAPPWNDGWTEATAGERLAAFARIPRFFGRGLIQANVPVAMALGWGERGVKGWHFHLKEMCVKHALQRQGLGSVLLASLERVLARENFTNIYLETSAASAACRFYKAIGYKERNTVTLSKPISN